METKYGSYSENQISVTVDTIRKTIFFLLLCVDPNTRDDYKEVDVVKVFRNLQYKLNGLNNILLQPPCIVDVMSSLEAACVEYERESKCDFSVYRKLILDAGAKILLLKEGG